MKSLLINTNGKAYVVNGNAQAAEFYATTKAGNAPLSLHSYISEALTGLVRYGKCSQASTPSPSSPVDIYCNNGVIKYGIPLTLNATRLYAYIRDEGLWVNYSDSYSIVVPVTIGKKYAIRLTNTESGTVGTIFRYGFSTRDTAGNTTTDLVQLTQWVRSTPQDISFVELTADNPYLIIQMSASSFSTVISSGYIVVTEQALYIDGTPEVLTLGQQTASVADLLQAGDFMDEQDIVTGVVTRRLGVKVLDGSENWSAGSTSYTLDNAISEVAYPSLSLCTHLQTATSDTTPANLPQYGMKVGASGYRYRIYIKLSAFASLAALKVFLSEQYAAGTPVIIIYPLKTPTTEQATAQPLNLTVGTNIIDAVANVSPVDLQATYNTI